MYNEIRYFIFTPVGRSSSPESSVKFLILTASYGEGHNTAARNIREAIISESSTTDVRIADLYSITNPRFNRWIQRGYSLAINRFTPLWKMVFLTLSREGVVETMIPLLDGLKRELAKEINSFKPDVIVSTYPIYSFLIEKLRRKLVDRKVPFVTVVTDSTIINSTWYRCHSDAFAVADHPTRDALCAGGVMPGKIHILGFPVSPRFEDVSPLPISSPPPWKILFLPSARTSHSSQIAELLLQLPNVHLTVLAGRLPQVAEAIGRRNLSGSLEIIAWTDQIPKLLASHHLFIGKAGGAFIQEAIAAQCPIIVSHLVPGQEEGNLRLIEGAGIGSLATGSPDHVRDVVAGVFANDAALWRAWKANIATISHPSASRDTARFLLEMARKSMCLHS
ncbi:MAG: hypothetical protein C5B47_08285 [Verrucomicrobia bacterium]|nr:MAG: hypothetical protein C5B47_08285 [Verrucomicrobiota bacterium]